MTSILDWLPQALRDQGLRVAEDDGWQGRSRPGGFGPVKGVLCHHTACGSAGNMPSLALLRNGRSDLAGPLAQLGLGRDGTFYVIAGGRANHAGKGSWKTIKDTGNDYFIGIEAENNGIGEHWPAGQILAYQHGVAAILDHINADISMCVGHKEYAVGRKIDPAPIDMDAFRAAVKAIMQNGEKAPMIPAAEPAGGAGRRTLQRPMKGDDVAQVQTKLKLPADGFFGSATEAAVRAFQAQHYAKPDGVVGPRTWALLDAG